METLIGILSSTYDTASAAVLAHAPRVFATLIVVVAGLVLARLARAAVISLLQAAKVEDIAGRVGATAALERADVGLSMTEIVGSLFYWAILLFTTFAALTTLDIADSSMFAGLSDLIPNVIVASTMLIVGLNLSSFLSKVIQTAAVNAGVRQARMARNASYYGMGALVVVLSLRRLGLSEELLTTSFLIMTASVGAAFALAFGLGSRELAGGIAKASWKHEREQSMALAEASEHVHKVTPIISVQSPQEERARGRGRAVAATP